MSTPLIRRTTGGSLFRQQRRRCPFRDRPFWSEMAVFGVTLVGMRRFRCIGRRQATVFR
jgi:hypothetical protein